MEFNPMKVRASAPGKAILFGEHAVVYGKPAIAVAVDKRAIVTIQEGTEDKINVEIPQLDLYALINPYNGNISEKGLISQKTIDKVDQSPAPYEAGILEYIQKALFKDVNSVWDHGINVKIDLEIPIGAGLGSSAAITVATLAAAASYHESAFAPEKLAEMAHQVELEVQGSASPLDTTVSTQGGFIYFTHHQGALKIKPALEMPLVVGYTAEPGNTGLLIKRVRKLCQNHPEIIKTLLDTMGKLTNQARDAIISGDQESLGELMNINQGLLDALGVNTLELSNLIYQARLAGATASKITGAGGGGSIIAYCPNKTQEVLIKLESVENAFPVNISSEGVKW
jgi:mevalonate kinase